VILYFLRHGKAGQPRAHDDDARELTARGVAALRSAARIWRRLKVRPDVIISSPLPRALQTAELFVEGVGLAAPPIIDDRLRPGADWSGMARAVADHRDAQSVMFVGHEPDLSSAVEELTGATAVRLRKGGVACLETETAPEPGASELVWLLDPDLYEEEPASDAS
jgi:phosphohistidine phosphatase